MRAPSKGRILAGATFAFAACGPLLAQEPLRLRYTQPAERWTEALPVGNGRLGAMVFGGVASERLQLNEATLWSGGPTDWNNPGAREVLPQVRAAIFAGDFVKATELAKKMQGPYNQSYQPLGDLRFSFTGDAAFAPPPTSAASTSTARSPPSATASAKPPSRARSSAAFPIRSSSCA